MTPILANLFITPWFFAAGAVLTSIPIVIHILNRRRFKLVPWAAMEFLLQAMRKNRRRLKFEQWLLLLARCALLVLVGAALARPLGCASSTLASLAGQRNGLHVFVIDNSYSMAYDAERPGAKTHLDQARLIASGMIDRIVHGGEAVVIITAGHPATAVIVKPTYSIEACHAALESIEQSYSGTDLAGAITKATDIAREDAKQPSKFLYILTDGTRSAFEGGQAEALKSAAREASVVFGDATHISLFNLGRPNQSNAAVLDLKPLDNLVTTKYSADFAAVARAYGNAATDPQLRWQIDDKDVGSGGGAVKLSEGSPPVLLPNQALRVGGRHVITASLVGGEDHLVIDNTRSRVVNVASEIKVLIVDGERSSQGLAGSGAFLELALAPTKGSSVEAPTTNPSSKSDSPLLPRVIGDQDLGDKEVLGQYRAILLTNVNRIPEAVAAQLQAFVEQGGVLMLFMGPRIEGDEYNRVLLTDKIHLLPGKLIEKISASNVGKDAFLFDFKPDSDLSSYLNVFKGESNSGLGTARIFTYWRLNPTNPTTERVLNYLPAGQSTASPSSSQPSEDPAITVHTAGKGKVIYFSTTANADWTSFPAKPAYVTLIHELLNGTIDPTDAWLNLTVGDAVELPGTLAVSPAPKLARANVPDSDIPVFEVTANDGRTYYRSQPLTRPGLYVLTSGNEQYPIAVNVPADEADVRTLTDGAIRKALGDIGVGFLGDQVPVEAMKQQSGNDLGWTLMMLVLMLAAVECYLAMRFGHYRRAAATQPASA
jgi:hypothetical protein